MRTKARKRTILLALTSTHHGFYRGAARYAAEHDWQVVADIIFDPTIPAGWRGDGIYEAAALLDRLIDGEPPPDIPQRIAPKGVVTRRSTKLLAVEDPTVSVALRYVQDNFREGDLSVVDVAAQCGVLRQSLERAFRPELQRTVLHQLPSRTSRTIRSTA
jgi:hypothetical protein